MPPALPPFEPRDGLALPLHRQLEAWLLDLIRLPPYQDGQTLPDEVSLARELGISRSTLRLALSNLEAEGLLERTPRVGTRVVRKAPAHHLDRWLSFRAEMAQQNLEVVDFQREVHWLPADAQVNRALGVELGLPILRLRRVRGWDGLPQMVADSWLHPRLNLSGDEDFAAPLYEILRRAGSGRPSRSLEQITASLGEPELRKLLALPRGLPLLVRRRTVLDPRGRAIEYNVNWYRGDQYTLSLELGPA